MSVFLLRESCPAMKPNFTQGQNMLALIAAFMLKTKTKKLTTDKDADTEVG